MKKDPSTLNENDLATYNAVNQQINNSPNLSESDKAIMADQRAMSKNRNAKSEGEQNRINKEMKNSEKAGQKTKEKFGKRPTNDEERAEFASEQAKEKKKLDKNDQQNNINE